MSNTDQTMTAFPQGPLTPGIETTTTSLPLPVKYSHLTPPETPSETPGAEASKSLQERLNELIFGPSVFAGWKCIYCAPHKNCKGGDQQVCFHSPFWVNSPSWDLDTFVEECDADVKHCKDIHDAFVTYQQKLDQHKPFTAELRQHEEVKNAEVMTKLNQIITQINWIGMLAQLSRRDGLGQTPSELIYAVAECHGWAAYFWSKMIKNHEYLKLNWWICLPNKA